MDLDDSLLQNFNNESFNNDVSANDEGPLHSTTVGDLSLNEFGAADLTAGHNATTTNVATPPDVAQYSYGSYITDSNLNGITDASNSANAVTAGGVSISGYHTNATSDVNPTTAHTNGILTQPSFLEDDTFGTILNQTQQVSKHSKVSDIPFAAAAKFVSLGFGVDEANGADGEGSKKKFTGPIKLLQPLPPYKSWELENSELIKKIQDEESILKDKQKKKGAEDFKKWNEERNAKIAALLAHETEQMEKQKSGSGEQKSLSWNMVNKLIDTESLQRSKDTSRMKQIITKLQKGENQEIKVAPDISIL